MCIDISRDSTQPSAVIRDMLNEYISIRDLRAMLQEIRSGASVEDIRMMLRQELASIQVISTTSASHANTVSATATGNAAEADAAWPD